MSSFTRDVKRLLKEQEEAEKKRKGLKGSIKLNPKLKNTLKKLNPLKNDKFKKLSNHKDKEAVKQAVDNQPVLDATTKETDEDYKSSVSAMEQFAIQFLKNEKYTAIIDNEKYDIEHFMGTLYGMEMTSPDLFFKMMQNENIEKAYDTYKKKYPYKKETKTGGSDTQSAKVPNDKTGQIKYIQKAVGTKDDGQWGKKTDAKWEEWIVSDGVTKAIEKILGVKTEPKKETPQKTPATPEKKPETKPEVQKESLNRANLRNLLETMAYFPNLLQEGSTKKVEGSYNIIVNHDAIAQYDKSDSSKFFMQLRVSKILIDGKNVLGKSLRIYPKASLEVVKVQAKPAVIDYNAGINISNQGGKNPRDLAKLVMAKIPEAKLGGKPRTKFQAQLESDLYSALGKAAKKGIAAGPPPEPETETSGKDGAKSPPKKKSGGKSGGKKSPPKRDNMGRQGKMGEIAKNRGNAAAIAKMLGFEGNLAGVAKAVAKIKANMPAPISENRKLFNTLRKYKIL